VRGADTLWAFGFPEKGRVKYYDRDGQSLQKALLRAPLKFSRVSSRFSKRRFHPTAKTYRPHNGTDYAAPAGTPIYAAGDGQVRFAGRKNGLGRCVEIRHPNGYVTVYGHMMKLAKGMHAGTSVRQRDVIGYVGMTGNASGHHLHYEVRQGKKPINPQTLKLPAKGPVPDALRPTFERHRDSLWQLLVPTYGPPLAGVM
jgi:murein DD-endopeptidase MepM/ murein hydrolase activator NlpD